MASDPLADLGAVEVDLDPNSTMLDINDPSELSDLGAEVVSPQELAEIKRQQELDAPFTAAGLGAARGLTFGLSDVIGRAQGGKKYAEYAQGLKDVNPAASIGGEVVGAIGGALVPVGAGAKLAQGAKALTTARLGEGVGASVAAQALEGGAYGIGQTISEQALGSPESVAESLLANVGMGAILGGGLTLGAEGAIRGASKLASKTKAILKGEDGLSKWLGVADPDEFMATERAIPGREAVKLAAAEEGVELTKGMKSGSEVVQSLESSLSQGGNYFNADVRKQTSKAMSGIQKSANNLLEEATEKTATQVGEEVKEAVLKKLTNEIDPVKNLYERLSKDASAIELEAKYKNRLIDNVTSFLQKEDKVGIPGARKILKALKSDSTASVRDIQMIRSALNDEASAAWRAGKSNEYRILAEVKNKLTRFEESSIRRTSINALKELEGGGKNEFVKLMAEDEGKAAARELIGEFKAAKKGYRQFKELLEEIGEQGKLGKINNLTQFADKLETIDAKTLANKLFNTKNVKAMRFFKEQFPEQFDALRRLEIAKIRNSAKMIDPVRGEVYNLREISKVSKKYEPEALEMIFDSAKARKLKNIETLVGATPRKIGPSGTPEGIDYQNMFNPAVIARDAIRWAAYNGLSIFEQTINKERQALIQKAKDFFSGAAKAAKVGTTVGLLAGSQKKYEARMEDIEALVNNPETYVQRIEENTKGIANIDPDLQIALSSKAMQAASYLRSKAPQNPFQGEMFGNRKWQPSDFELSMFNRYVQVVDDPISVLDDMNANLLTKESVDAFRTVYPELFAKVQKEYTDQAVALEDDLDFAKKNQLSMLLGVNTTSVQDQSFVQALQANNAVAGAQEDQMQQQQQAAPKTRQLKSESSSRMMSQSEKLISSRGG